MNKGHLNEHLCKYYLYQATLGLSHSHSMNIVHRDIKPENIMFKDIDNTSLKLIDFGLGIKDGRNNNGNVVGTPW